MGYCSIVVGACTGIWTLAAFIFVCWWMTLAVNQGLTENQSFYDKENDFPTTKHKHQLHQLGKIKPFSSLLLRKTFHLPAANRERFPFCTHHHPINFLWAMPMMSVYRANVFSLWKVEVYSPRHMYAENTSTRSAVYPTTVLVHATPGHRLLVPR